MDAEILAAVRAQSSSGGRARGELASAKSAIEELFGRIRDIQRKARRGLGVLLELPLAKPVS